MLTRRLIPGCVAALLACTALPVGSHAQEARVSAPLPVGLEGPGAETTRNQLRELMRQYPPALGRVLRLDPTLMTNPQYLAPYPTLAAFLKQKPEVARYPSYFLSFVPEGDNWAWREPATPELERQRNVLGMWEDVMVGLLVLVIAGTVSAALVALVRSFLGHRRWLRATKIQADFHNRLLERMGSSSEVLAYAQSSSRDLLPAVPQVGAASQAIAPPFGRILWSVQAGVVAAAVGIGLLIAKGYVHEDIGPMLLTMGVLVLSLGVGFALAAVASYMLSLRLGLLSPPPTDARREPLGG